MNNKSETTNSRKITAATLAAPEPVINGRRFSACIGMSLRLVKCKMASLSRNF